MPEGAVYVGRPSKWGNPFTGPQAISSFRAMGHREGAWIPVAMPWPKGKIPNVPLTTLEDVHDELRGKDLACWCPLEDADGNPVPCHADVLLEWANS